MTTIFAFLGIVLVLKMADWKCAEEMLGGLFVMIIGTMTLLRWHADSLVFLTLVNLKVAE